MKLLITSDIHGSAYYAKKVVMAYHDLHCDKLLLLGDILYHGPRNPLPKDYDPKEVIALLNPLKHDIIACRGNCDSEVDQMVLEFPLLNTSQTILEKDRTIYLSHGHIYHPDRLPESIQKNDIFLFGHIHIPVMEKKDDIYIINPGSISLPKESNPHTFAILDNNTLCFLDEEQRVLKTYDIK